PHMVAKSVFRPLWNGLSRLTPRPIKRAVKRVLGLAQPEGRKRFVAGLEPLSYLWGADRGVPIYYYYILQFLREFSPDVRGHCLEFYNDQYTTQFGGAAVTQLDILHIDDTNPRATLVGDLTKPNNFPGNRFDCIICTHTLHVIFELDKAISELHRMLKPGG